MTVDARCLSAYYLFMSGIEARARDREKRGERRRRLYAVTLEGKRVLATQRKIRAAFVDEVRRVTGDEDA